MSRCSSPLLPPRRQHCEASRSCQASATTTHRDAAHVDPLPSSSPLDLAPLGQPQHRRPFRQATQPSKPPSFLVCHRPWPSPLAVAKPPHRLLIRTTESHPSTSTTFTTSSSQSQSSKALTPPLPPIDNKNRKSFHICYFSQAFHQTVWGCFISVIFLSFCIIEGPETVQDFMQMQLQEIQDNIRSRRNKIFLLMEEVRRLRVQQRIKSTEFIDDSSMENEMPDIPSTIPFVPRMTPKTLKQLYLTSFSFVSAIICFGGLIAPVLELKLGLGGTSYEDFIRNVNLPLQLSQVDPIVASFSGGAVGVISALMLVEVNNVEQQEKKRCKYCHGTGYLACARCSATGVLVSTEPVSITGGCDSPLRAPSTKRCQNCSGAGKVMCPTCLCTGMVMASEHDPRIDPFD